MTSLYLELTCTCGGTVTAEMNAGQDFAEVQCKRCLRRWAVSTKIRQRDRPTAAAMSRWPAHLAGMETK